MTDYMEQSHGLLAKAHEAATDALTSKLAQRVELVRKLVSVDAQIVHLSNQRADFATSCCRLNGLANILMPSTCVTVESDDPYIPNPFAGIDRDGVDDFSDRDGLLLEGADQIGGMKYLDADITLCAFTREGLLKFLKTVMGKKRYGKIGGAA